jgi:hypothetical protein
VLPSRALAGALVGRVLPPLFWSGAAVGLFVALLSHYERRTTSLATALAITAACLVAQLGVAPRIEQVRAAVGGGPIDALARNDARRVAFGRLHGASVALLGIAGIAASLTLVLTARALSARPAPTFRETLDDG